MQTGGRQTWSASLFCALAFLSSSAARAEAAFLGPEERTQVRLEVDFASIQILSIESGPPGSIDAFAMDVTGQLDLSRHLALTLSVPWGVVHESNPASTAASAGNVQPGLQIFGHVRPNLLLWGNVSLGIPTVYQAANLPPDLATDTAATGGAYRFERYVPAFASIRGVFGLEVGFATRLRYRFGVALLAGDFVVGSSGLGFSLESSSELEVRLPRHFILGGRLQFVPIFPGGFFPGLGAGAYVGYEAPGTGMAVRLEYLYALSPLDRPGGSATGDVVLELGYQFS